MSTDDTNAKNATGSRRIYSIIGIGLSLGLTACVLATAVPAFAQEAEAAMDQESLLPPEVVPLDPSAARQMTRSQAASREVGLSAPAQAVPGLSGIQPLTPPSDMQSAQDFRKAMFNSLYNQGTLAPANQQPQMAQSAQSGQQQQTGQSGGQQPQSNYFAAQQQPNQQVSPPSWTTAKGAPQQQRLSGGVENPSGKPNSTFNGVKHVLGTATGFGGGMLVGALMMRNGNSSPAALMGLGLLGGSVLNYGMRNAWRGF